ncbi:MAG: molybdopterin molybdotransferase MoeA [Agarilytica sp.]
MLEIDQAQQHIYDAVEEIRSTDTISIADAHERVLAKDIISHMDVPPETNSAMDGFSVCIKDIKEVPTTLPVGQRIAAGDKASPQIPQTASRIFTGAVIPENADAVVMQENCEYNDDPFVTINKMPHLGENIRIKGQDIAADTCILEKGQKLQAQHIGLLASIGQESVEVKRQICVSLLCTGDELVNPGDALRPGQIYNSNQYMLASMLRSTGVKVKTVPAAADELDTIKDKLSILATTSDLIISTGGVSVGEEDHVKTAVEALGSLDLWKVNIKPGKPLAFGKIKSTRFLGLPGNPVSAFVTFAFFALPVIKKLQGQMLESPFSITVPACFEISKKKSRPELMRVSVSNKGAEAFPNQSSGVLSSVTWSNALALIPSQTLINEGDPVRIFPIDTLLK